MSIPFRPFMRVELMVAALVNATLNFIMVFVMFYGVDPVPVQGRDGIAFDLLPTCFFTGFLMVMMVSPILRLRRKKGQTPDLAREMLPALMAWLPHSDFIRALIIGLCSVVAIGGLGGFILDALGITSIPFSVLLPAKATFGAVLGVFLCPFVVLPVLAENR